MGNLVRLILENESYLIDLNTISDQNLKEAIEYVISLNFGDFTTEYKKFGDYEVSYGQIIQFGYSCNDLIQSIALKDDIKEITIQTYI